MSTRKLTIKDGKIVTDNGNVTSIDVHGNWRNPWHVEIKHNKIFCTCEAEYSTGIQKKKKVFPLQDGTLGLSGGNINGRYAYFRSTEFQNWLDDMGITAIQRLESPDFEYIGHHASCCGAGTADYYIATDGEEVISEPYWSAEWLKDYDGWCADDSKTRYVYKNCTWVLVASSCHYRDNHNHAVILYVPKGVNPMDLTEQIWNYAPRKRREAGKTVDGCHFGCKDRETEAVEEAERNEYETAKRLCWALKHFLVDSWYSYGCTYRAYNFCQLAEDFVPDGDIDAFCALIRKHKDEIYTIAAEYNNQSKWYLDIEDEILAFADGECEACREFVRSMKGVSYASMYSKSCKDVCAAYKYWKK